MTHSQPSEKPSALALSFSKLAHVAHGTQRLACPSAPVRDLPSGRRRGEAPPHEKVVAKLAEFSRTLIDNYGRFEKSYEKLDEPVVLTERVVALLSRVGFQEALRRSGGDDGFQALGAMFRRMSYMSKSGVDDRIHLVGRKVGSVVEIYEPYLPLVHDSSDAVDVEHLEGYWVLRPQRQDGGPDVYMSMTSLADSNPPPVSVTLTWIGTENVQVSSQVAGASAQSWPRTDFLNKTGNHVIGWVFNSAPFPVVNGQVDFQMTITVKNKTHEWGVRFVEPAATDPDPEEPEPIFSPTPVPEPPPPAPVPDWIPTDWISAGRRPWTDFLIGPIERQTVGRPLAELLAETSRRVNAVLVHHKVQMTEALADAVRERLWA